MCNSPSFNEITNSILQDYYKTFQVEPVNASYVISDDMTVDYAQLRPDHAEKEPEKIASLRHYNGNTVCPKEIRGEFTVLINKEKLLEYINVGNMTWVGTIVHETTHVRDFVDYAKLIGAADYEDIININKNAAFQLWTEFNARSKGYYFVRKYTFENMFDLDQIEDIVNFELPKQNEFLYRSYHRTDDGYQQAYYVSHYLGRLHSLQKIFPTYFTLRIGS